MYPATPVMKVPLLMRLSESSFKMCIDYIVYPAPLHQIKTFNLYPLCITVLGQVMLLVIGILHARYTRSSWIGFSTLCSEVRLGFLQ